MISSIYNYYNKNYSYNKVSNRSAAASAFQLDTGLRMEATKPVDEVKTGKASMFDKLDSSAKSDLVNAYKDIDWNDEESIMFFLQKGVDLGFLEQKDLDQAFLCVEDPNLLNKVQYIPNRNSNFIKNSLDFEKLQLKMARDFYNNMPQSLACLEAHLSSLTKVWDFISGVSAL